jgi:hypothetical protein
MSNRRVIADTHEWRLPESSDATATLNQIEQALATGAVARLELLDAATGSPVTVYLNGATTHAVTVDLGAVPRPSEISGFAIEAGGSKWRLPAADATDTAKRIEQALDTGSVARLELLDAATGGAVTVFLNGKTASPVALDHGDGPRSGENAGS